MPFDPSRGPILFKDFFLKFAKQHKHTRIVYMPYSNKIQSVYHVQALVRLSLIHSLAHIPNFFQMNNRLKGQQNKTSKNIKRCVNRGLVLCNILTRRTTPKNRKNLNEKEFSRGL